MALAYTPRQCAASRTLPPPLLDARKSVPSTARANMCASIGVTGYRRSGKLPAPLCHRSPALSQTVRGHGDAALTRRIALSRSARLGSSPILKSDYRRRSSTPCVRIRGCLRACVCGYTIAVGCPSFTLCQELNTDGRYGLPAVRAMQLRKVSGEKNRGNTVSRETEIPSSFPRPNRESGGMGIGDLPERIPRSVSGSRT